MGVGAGGSKTQAAGRGKGRHAFLGCPEQVPRPPGGAAGPGRHGPQPAPPLSLLAGVGGGQPQGQGQGPFPMLPTVLLAEGPQGEVQAGQQRPRRPEMREALASQAPAQFGRDAAPGPGAPRMYPPPPVCLAPRPGRLLRSHVSTRHAWDSPVFPLSLPQGPRNSGQGAGEHVSYLQPSLAGREARPGLVLAAAGCRTPHPEAQVGWGQGKRRNWSCCRPSAGVPPGEGSQEGKGCRPLGTVVLWPHGGSLGRALHHPWSFRQGVVSGGAQALGSIREVAPGRGQGRACPPRCWRSVSLLPPTGVALSGSPGTFLPGRQR